MEWLPYLAFVALVFLFLLGRYGKPLRKPAPPNKDYIIVKARTVGDLEKQVNEHMKMGYEPVGSMTADGLGYGVVTQPMRKKPRPAA